MARLQRARNISHNYCTYGRKRVLGELNRDARDPRVQLTKLGQFVQEQWLKIPEMQATKGRKVRILGHQVMPDHFHGILGIDEPLTEKMGAIIRDFKAACTQEYRREYQPRLADAVMR